MQCVLRGLAAHPLSGACLSLTIPVLLFTIRTFLFIALQSSVSVNLLIYVNITTSPKCSSSQNLLKTVTLFPEAYTSARLAYHVFLYFDLYTSLFSYSFIFLSFVQKLWCGIGSALVSRGIPYLRPIICNKPRVSLINFVLQQGFKTRLYTIVYITLC